MNGTDHLPETQEAPAVMESDLSTDALDVVCSYFALVRPECAFALLEYLHDAASRVPDEAGPYLHAAEKVRRHMGFPDQGGDEQKEIHTYP